MFYLKFKNLFLNLLDCILNSWFQYILGKVFIPLAWVMGVEWKECEDVARLIGLKTIVNEFVAYEQLGKLKIGKKLSVREIMILLFRSPYKLAPCV
jgi:nucleoside permease NupC